MPTFQASLDAPLLWSTVPELRRDCERDSFVRCSTVRHLPALMNNGDLVDSIGLIREANLVSQVAVAITPIVNAMPSPALRWRELTARDHACRQFVGEGALQGNVSNGNRVIARSGCAPARLARDWPPRSGDGGSSPCGCRRALWAGTMRKTGRAATLLRAGRSQNRG
jgi:hypothetical protein